MVHIRQSMPDSGLGFQVNVLNNMLFSILYSLGCGRALPAETNVLTNTHKEAMESMGEEGKGKAPQF